MCMIIDANIVNEIFGRSRTPAGEKVFDWILKRRGTLVIGGKLSAELERTSMRKSFDSYENFGRWAATLQNSFSLNVIDDTEVESRTAELIAKNQCKSDDHHIIALAQISGARLLYSNDRDLHKDFKNKQLIDNPRGKVYSTMKETEYKDRHKRLLENRDLCRTH